MPILNCFYRYLQFIEKAQQNKDSHNTTLLSLHICSSRFQTLLKLFIKKTFYLILSAALTSFSSARMPRRAIK